jgi:hypothetical protein
MIPPGFHNLDEPTYRALDAANESINTTNHRSTL